jgi:L-malate glycosyltransferase
MKILHTVEFYSPSVGGAQEVVRRISEQLVRRGHEVTVATTHLPERESTYINGVRVEGFSISGNEVLGYRGETDRYLSFLADGKFDVMMNYAAQQWATDLVFSIVSKLPYRKVMAPCGFSALSLSKYEPYFRKMPDIMRQYDHLIVHSEMTRDSQFIRQHGMNHYSVMPNGAAREEFEHVTDGFRERYGIPRGIPMVLTVGSHTGAKGHSLSMKAFAQAKIGRAVLVIIGNILGGIGCLRRCQMQAAWVRFRSLGQKNVLLLDLPRKDVVSAYRAADLFVFGSNIECSPIVLFEAMAAETPFVSSDVGNAREIAEWSGSGIIIPTVQDSNGLARAAASDMSRAIENLLSDPSRRQAMAQAGHDSWKERFSWERIAAQYESLYDGLIRR